MEGKQLKLRRNAPGAYQVRGTNFWIVRTEWDGPKGGTGILWEPAMEDRWGLTVGVSDFPLRHRLQEVRADWADYLSPVTNFWGRG